MTGSLIPTGPGGAGADIIGVGIYRLSKDRPNTFVATWYSIAIAIVTLVSSYAGRRALRW